MTTQVIAKQQFKIYLFVDAADTFHFACGDAGPPRGFGLRLGVGRHVGHVARRAFLVVLGHRLNGLASLAIHADGGCRLLLRLNGLASLAIHAVGGCRLAIHARHLALTVHDLPRAHHARRPCARIACARANRHRASLYIGLVLASGVSVPPAPSPPLSAFSPPGSTFPSPVTPAKLCREGPQLVAGLFVLPTSLMAILRNPSGPAESQGWELSRPAKSRTLELKWLRNFKSIVYGQLIESFKDHFPLLVNCIVWSTHRIVQGSFSTTR